MRTVAVWVLAILPTIFPATIPAATGPAPARGFQSVDENEATLLQTGPGRAYCPNCGMNLVKFYRTSHGLPGDREPARQYCSLHCLVEVYPEVPAGVLVADAASLQLVPAESAHYVVGSDAPGTMTMNSKYAFAALSDAEAFVAGHGGRLTDFAGAVAAAREGLDAENRMIDGKRSRMAGKGARILAKMCPDLQTPPFTSLFEAKTWLTGRAECAGLDDGQLQAAAIHLVRGSVAASAEPIDVPQQARCPVCGMFVGKYPQWAAEARTAAGASYYFDGVKDLMKFLFAPDRFHAKENRADFTTIRVTGYYSLNALDARRAWYVTGSNVYGPMGNELIPFATEQDARTFLDDHSGERVLEFEDIDEELVHALDR